jgi:hypothetical protein
LELETEDMNLKKIERFEFGTRNLQVATWNLQVATSNGQPGPKDAG